MNTAANERAQQAEDNARAAEQNRRAQEEAARCSSFRATVGEKLRALDAIGQVDTYIGEIEKHEANLARARAYLAALHADGRAACGSDGSVDDTRALQFIHGYADAIEEEKTCRPNPACVARHTAQRVVEDAQPVCAAAAATKEALALVARIRANGARFGVVNRYDLKDAGDDVVRDEEAERAARAAFTAKWHRAWSPAMCRRDE